VPKYLWWLSGASDILDFETQTEQAVQHLQQADIIFALDYNDLQRVEQMEPYIRRSDAFKAMIDHHLYPTDFVQYALTSTAASSTCELVYEFITRQLSDAAQLDLDIAIPLYTGILTDTGFLNYGTSAALYRTIAGLLDTGLQPTTIHETLLNTYTPERLRLLGWCLSERFELLPCARIGLMALEHHHLLQHQVAKPDLEGVVNYMLKVQTVQVAVLLTEFTPGQIKLSVRSKGPIDVQAFCAAHYQGGGHKNAAGGTAYQPMHQVLSHLRAALPQHINLYAAS
jgi:phosphoesterase RecJ-like protein